MKRFIGLFAVLVLLVACGGSWDGPELGAFPAISKNETDAPFTLTPPSSRSPAPFSFTSSDPTVATISGATVTLHGVGTSTITASQPRDGAYGPTSKSTLLTVSAVACDTGTVRVNGTCTPIKCVSPATLSNNQCVAGQTGATATTNGALTWMGVSFSASYADASAFCANTVIETQTGWRLPTADELKALVASGAIAGHGWTLGNTWSSGLGTTLASASHVTVNLETGDTVERADTAGAYVTCVR